MTTATETAFSASQDTDVRGLVAVAATVGAIGCAGYISTIFLYGEQSVRDSVRSPVSIVSNLLVALAFAALAAALPVMGARLGLPRWASLLGGAGCAAVVATSFGTATLAVHAAGLLTDEQMEQESVWFLLFQAPQSLPLAIAFITLGTTVIRRRTPPRSAGWLLAVAGVLSLLPAYPPGCLLASLGLLALSRGKRDDQSPRG